MQEKETYLGQNSSSLGSFAVVHVQPFGGRFQPLVKVAVPAEHICVTLFQPFTKSGTLPQCLENQSYFCSQSNF